VGNTRPSGLGTLWPVTLYAAYGTNLDPARMGERCPHSILHSTGWLAGWRLTFGGEEHGWDGALSTIVQDPFEQVFVAVYDVTSASYLGVLADAADAAGAPEDYVAALRRRACRSTGL
jgi:hypothetical protein